MDCSVTVSCNLSDCSAGGSGCTVSHRTPILRVPSLGKVSVYLRIPVLYTDTVTITAVGRKLIYCEPVEFVTLNPPSGMTCGDYMKGYMSFAGGYLVDASASTTCQFCSTRTTDEFLAGNFNIRYSDRWWHLGIFVAYIVFNVRRQTPCFTS